MASNAYTLSPIKLIAAVVLPTIVGSLGFGVYASTNPSAFSEPPNSFNAFISGSIVGLFFVGIELAIVSTAIYIFLALRNTGRLSRKFYSYAAPSFFLTFFIVTAIGAGLSNYYGQLTDPSITPAQYGKEVCMSGYCGAILGALVLMIFMLCSRLKAPATTE